MPDPSQNEEKFKFPKNLRFSNFLKLPPGVPGINFYAPWGPRALWDPGGQLSGPPGPQRVLISLSHIHVFFPTRYGYGSINDGYDELFVACPPLRLKVITSV